MLSGGLPGKWALIRGPEKVIAVDLSVEQGLLYDLQADPRETTDLSETREAAVRDAVEAVRKLLDDYPMGTIDGRSSAEESIPEHEYELLQALGYVE